MELEEISESAKKSKESVDIEIFQKDNNVTSEVENASTKLEPKKEESEFQGFSKLNIEKNITNKNR